MIEAEPAARRLGQRGGPRWRRDRRLLVQQFVEPAGGTGAAQKIAVNFG